VVDVAKLFTLAGKTAIVTGGTGGLGTGMTMALASAGADIVSISSQSSFMMILAAETLKKP